MRTARLLLVSCLILIGSPIGSGCVLEPESPRGFRLPEGDAGRGEVAFRELGCPECHDVVGGPPPPEGDRFDVIVTLGGEVGHVMTHGELVTSIIHPSYKISRRHPRQRVADGDESRMENFNDQMTVAQLIDLVAFLESKYEVRREPLLMP